MAERADIQVGWTDERVETLKQMWADGASSATIGREIGVSRNAVLGKVHRLGINNMRPKPAPKPPKPPKLPKAVNGAAKLELNTFNPQRGVRRAPTFPQEQPAPKRQCCTFWQLTPRRCRWPFGEVGTADFHFCGAKSVKGLPYCAEHARMAYRPAERRATRAA